MLELAVLAAFAGVLFICIRLGVELLIALVFGFLIFSAYGLYKGHRLSELIRAALSGMETVKNILLTFFLIGIITAMWRISGTIPFIVYHAAGFCSPQAMVLICFLLCCLISALTGTAFGTAATMGIICVTMANSMGVPIAYSGGAVLAGSYFGDRCSPMSTSALLVSSLTGTDLFKNIVNMVKSSYVPFILSCAIYLLMGMSFAAGEDSSGIHRIFAENFAMHPAAIIPAAVIVLFSLFRVKVKLTMTVSIICAALVAVLVQKCAVSELIHAALFGYQPENAELAALLSGGGVLSMLRVLLIVCLSSGYAGIFGLTGMLDNIRTMLLKLSRILSPYGCVLVTAVVTAVIACNQTLTIMLTHQLCTEAEPDAGKMALYLEDSAVVIPPLIPWSIACAVTLASVSAPAESVGAAVYLYLLVIWNLILNFYRHLREKNGTV